MDETIPEEVITSLSAKAKNAMRYAYAPYSGFKVGAALIGSNGQVYTGCNIENSSFGLTICAERNAVFHAVLDGCTKLKAIVICNSESSSVMPCGACRQVLSEFSDDLQVMALGKGGEKVSRSLESLLPFPFVKDDLSDKERK